ncbi:uncharacterized protein LOC124666723 isoform X2 [Lolium rigidum]|uniref:uncharacterized protein LOC124666723 isoform X2 n=1 Tax=Lolium rigidum TaxID=89674 RepID=UPI001F5E0B4B|nr:uncharacterized protein LOC124666723 isoform X2 [Lolium rigidum]
MVGLITFLSCQPLTDEVYFASTKETSEKIKAKNKVTMLQAKNKVTMLQARSSIFMIFSLIVLFREMGHVWIEEVKKLAYWQYINFKQQGRSKMDIRLGLYSGIASAMLSHARRYTGGIHRGQSDPWQGVNTSDLAISLPSRDTSILCCGYII